MTNVGVIAVNKKPGSTSKSNGWSLSLSLLEIKRKEQISQRPLDDVCR